MALVPDPSPGADTDRFAVDPTRPLPDAGGGVPAFAASDRRDPGGPPLMALRLDRAAPARVLAAARLEAGIDGILAPLGAAVAGGDAYLVAHAPPGPPLSASLRAWPEAALLGSLLRPAATALRALEDRGATHRAIRLDNVFAGKDGRVVLGTAWAEPPAMRQPALFEPPHVAMCHPAGRGDGTIADDVYALGVLMLCLALGRDPLEGLDPEAVIRRKLALGSHAALIGEARLPSAVADIVRTMLAEDPDHRPTPALLLDPVAARGRRVAARPPPRAGAPLRIGAVPVWDVRTLAYAAGRYPDPAAAALRGGEISTWLRRGLGDAGLAVRFEELQRARLHEGPAQDPRADAAMLMRAVAAADALAPLCWQGVAMMPDGIGPLLAHARDAEPGMLEKIEQVVVGEVVVGWAALNAERHDLAAIRIAARDQRALLRDRGAAGGIPRLAYALNAGLPCASPLARSRWADSPRTLLGALEAHAARGGAEGEPMDPDIAGFLAARTERRVDAEINGLNARGDAERALARLRLLAALQARYHPAPLPALAKWLVAGAEPLIAQWRNRAKRESIAAELNAVAEHGQIAALLALADDGAERARDSLGAAAAGIELAGIEVALAAIERGAAGRQAFADRIGQELAAGAGLAAMAAALGAAALG